jgi:hypothetical protein
MRHQPNPVNNIAVWCPADFAGGGNINDKERKSYVTEKISSGGRNEKCVDVTMFAGPAAVVFNARFERQGANQL